MAYSYDIKVIISGKYVEIYRYKKKIWKDYTRRSRKEKDVFVGEENLINKEVGPKKQKRAFSLNRTRTEIRRLINSNPQLIKLITLTFAENWKDLKTANREFNKFVLRMVYRYPDFEYLAVPEFQKRGAVHYHFICNLPYVHFSKIREIWRNGNIDVTRLKNKTNLGAYVCKYLNKDMFDKRAFGKKKFFRSQTLSEPTAVLGFLATRFVDKFLSNSKPVFEKTFESEWVGEVDYKMYNLDTPPFADGFDKDILLRPV